MSTARLIVSVSGRRLAVDLDGVQEIADRGTVTLLPQMPPAMPGVVAIRGTAVPLIDLGVLAGDSPRHDHRSVLVATDGKRPMALLIDAVEWIDDAETLAGEEDLEVLDLRSLLDEIR